MKLIFATAFIFVGSVCGYIINDKNDAVEVTTESTIDIKEEFAKLFEEKCEKIGGKDAYSNLFKATESTYICIKSHWPDKKNETDSDSSSSEEICAYKHNNIRECFNKFIEALKDCSEPEEKYFPGFVFDVLDNIIDLLCIDNKIAHLMHEDGSDCIDKLFEDDKTLNVCFDKHQFAVLKPDDKLVTKEELCSDIDVFGKCFSKFVEKKCPKDKQLLKSLSQLYKAVEGPCHK